MEAKCLAHQLLSHDLKRPFHREVGQPSSLMRSALNYRNRRTGDVARSPFRAFPSAMGLFLLLLFVQTGLRLKSRDIVITSCYHCSENCSFCFCPLHLVVFSLHVSKLSFSWHAYRLPSGPSGTRHANPRGTRVDQARITSGILIAACLFSDLPRDCSSDEIVSWTFCL